MHENNYYNISILIKGCQYIQKYCLVLKFSMKEQLGRDYMRNLKKWLENKPPFLAFVAYMTTTVGVEVLPIFLTMLKRGERFEFFGALPAVREWMRLYRDHRRVEKVVRENIQGWGEVGEKGEELLSSFMDGLRYVKDVGIEEVKIEMQEANTEELRQSFKTTRENWNEFFNRLVAELELTDAGEINEEQARWVRQAFSGPEWEFFSRVWLVCSFFYGEHPGRLLRKARLGDIEAMEKLLRLDKAVVSDEKIAGHLNRLYWEKKATYDRLIRALRGGVKIKATPKNMKYVIAGLISQLSILLGHKLNEPEIRGLFNAISRDQGRGLEDQDLVQGSDDFRRTISRTQEFWARVSGADKK
jgi:hypothetical protein